MSVTLDYIGETVVAFKDDTYRWVSVKRFGLTGRGPTAAVLSVLIGHPEYLEQPDRPEFPPRHGPYDLRAITPAAFEAVGPASVSELIDGLYRLHDRPPAPAVRDRVAIAVSALGAAECHRLREMPESVVMGGAFLDFQEVVGIDWAGRAVYLLILAADV